MRPVGYHEDIARDGFVRGAVKLVTYGCLQLLVQMFRITVPNSSRMSVYVMLRIEAALMGLIS